MTSAPPPPPPSSRASAWRALWPAALAVDARERWRIVVGVGLGLGFTGALCAMFARSPGQAWLVAPLGASAVLVFGLPASPLAQPWAVVAGNTLSALAGLAWAAVPGLPQVAAAGLAPATAVALMLAARCLHPPGGAMALLVVLGGVQGWGFALFPALLNSLLLVAAGMAWNSATGRRYPHATVPASGTLEVPGFTEADLDAVLARYNQVLDLPRDDLRHLLADAEMQAHRRVMDSLRCSDIMSQPVTTVSYGTPLQQAWALLRSQRIKALPVVDRSGRVVGILTMADFMRAADLDLHEGFDAKLRRLLRSTPGTHADKPEAVGQIMTRQVRVASADRSLAELVPIFASTGHHHLPIVAADGRLAGIVTQSDLVAALVRSGQA